MVKDDFDRDKANVFLNNIIHDILTIELPSLRKKITNLCLESKKTKLIIFVMSLIIFSGGCFLLITSIYIINSENISDDYKTIGSLGFGCAGGLSFISLFLINPINKIQKANSDSIQSEIILYCWEMAILLHIRAMDITDRKNINETADKIKELTINCIQLLERYYEEPEKS